MKNLFQAVLLAASLLIAAAFPVKADGIFNPGSSGGGGGAGTPEQVINITAAPYNAVCDGTTNDNTAINAAFTAAAASAAYQANTKIHIVGPADATHKGCVINSINATGFTLGNGANTRPQVEISNMTLLCTGAGNTCMDFTGSTFIKMHDVSIRGDATPGLVPEICIQVAITTQNTSSAWHMFERVNCNNSFGFADLYNFGSESNQYIGNVWQNANIAIGPIVRLGTITPGSAYTNGTYTNVPLTGGSGTGALATVVVSGAAVSAVTVTYEGRDYAPSDTLSAAAANIGGTGSGFSVPVAAAAPFSVVLDGQNHWRAASAFVSITAPTETWESLTLLTFVGDNIRNGVTSTENAATIWMGWVGSTTMSDTYTLNSGNGTLSSCIEIFDNGVTHSGIQGPNSGLNIDDHCEGGSPYGIFLSGSNATPALLSAQLRMSILTTATAVFGNSANITSISAPNSNWTFTYPQTMQVFASAKLWTVTGVIGVPSITGWNSPASFQGQLTLATLATPQHIGPLDIYSTSVGLAISCARQLSRSYIGPLCQFTRASDSTTLSVYPNALGDLDPNAFNSFCNNTTCKVSEAFDQSGNGNNCTQGTAASQPTFSLQLAALGNRPTMTFGDAGALALTCPAAATINNIWAAGAYVSAVVNYATITSATDRLMAKTWFSAVPNGSNAGGRLSVPASTTAGDWSYASVALGAAVVDVQYSFASLANVPTFGNNGTSRSLSATQQPVGTETDDSASALIIGNSVVTSGTAGFPGSIAEILIFKSTPANTAISPQLEAVRRNQGAYYGLGSTVN